MNNIKNDINFAERCLGFNNESKLVTFPGGLPPRYNNNEKFISSLVRLKNNDNNKGLDGKFYGAYIPGGVYIHKNSKLYRVGRKLRSENNKVIYDADELDDQYGSSNTNCELSLTSSSLYTAYKDSSDNRFN